MSKNFVNEFNFGFEVVVDQAAVKSLIKTVVVDLSKYNPEQNEKYRNDRDWINKNFYLSYGEKCRDAVEAFVACAMNQAAKVIARKTATDKVTGSVVNATLRRKSAIINCIDEKHYMMHAMNNIEQCDLERMLGSIAAKNIVMHRNDFAFKDNDDATNEFLANSISESAKTRLMLMAEISRQYVVTHIGEVIEASDKAVVDDYMSYMIDSQMKHYDSIGVNTLVELKCFAKRCKSLAKAANIVRKGVVKANAVIDAAKHKINTHRHEVQALAFEHSFGREGNSETMGVIPTVTAMGRNVIIDKFIDKAANDKVKLLMAMNRDGSTNNQGTDGIIDVNHFYIDNSTRDRKHVALRDLCQVSFSNGTSLAKNLIEDGFYIYDGKVYVSRHSGENNSLEHLLMSAAPISIEEMYELSFLDNKSSKAVNAEMMKEVKTYGFHYHFFLAGASDNRNQTAWFLLREENESYDEFKARCVSYYDELTGGMFSKIVERGDMNSDQLFKAVGRIALAWTPSTELGVVSKFAYVGKACSLNSCAPLDGLTILQAEWGQKQFAKQGINYTLDEVRTLNVQNRAGKAPIKGFTPCFYTSETIATLINENALVNGMHLNVQNMTMDEFVVAYEEKKQPRLRDFITIVGDSLDIDASEVEAILDPNSVKEVFNDGKIMITELAVGDASKANLNSQIINNELVRVPGFIDKLIEETISSGMDKLNREFEKNDAVKVINPESYVVDQLFSVAPALMINDESIWWSKINNFVNGINSSYGNFKFPINGMYGHTTGDIAAWFGIEVVHEDEVFATGLTSRHIAKEGEKVALFRNPKVDGGENVIAKAVSLKTVIGRIEASSISEAQKKALIAIYSSYGPSIVVYGPYPSVPTRLGGADHDFDGVTIVADWIVEFIEKIGARGVNQIENHSTDIARLSYEKVLDCYMKQALNIDLLDPRAFKIAVETVGILSNRVSLFSCIANLDDIVVEHLMKYIEYNLKLRDGDKLPKKSGHEYVPYFHKLNILANPIEEIAIYNIGDKEAHLIEERFINSDRSVKSFKLFLSDVILAYAAIIGRIIDAAKKGDNVDTYLAAFVIGKNWDGFRIYDKETGEKAWTIKCRFKEEAKIVSPGKHGDYVYTEMKHAINKEDRIVVFADPLSVARDKIMSKLCSFVNKYVSVLRAYGHELNEAMLKNAATPDAAWRKLYANSDMRYAKEVYDRIINNVSNADGKEEVKKALADMIRGFFDWNKVDFSGKTEQEVYEIKCFYTFMAMRTASLQSGKTVAMGFNSFWTLLAEEALVGLQLMSCKIAKAMGFEYVPTKHVGYELSTLSNANINDGDVITFVDGASTDGTVFARGSKKANGEYVVREIDGVLYATRSIADEFHAPEPTGKVVLMSTRRASMDEPDVMNNELAAQIYTAEELKIAMYKNRNGNGHGEKSRLMIMKNGNEINSMILQHPGYAYTKNEELNGKDLIDSSIVGKDNFHGKGFDVDSVFAMSCVRRETYNANGTINKPAFSYKQGFVIGKLI